MATYTVKEQLEFAAKIRTDLSDHLVNSRVEFILDLLGLSQCKDSLVGGWMRRGISGGERKRTSIGYELITEPSVLLLDEPTSGLDSSTSKRIIQLLRKEAQRGVTIMATIHQPSSDIFMMFDKVIVLSEGYTIYTGPPLEVRPYFEKFGLKMSNYSNPADKVSIIAAEPRATLNEEINIISLHQSCKTNLHQYQELNTKEKKEYEGRLNTRMSIIGESRNVPFCKQYRLLFKRFMVFIQRTPEAVFAIVFMALMQSFLQASLFHGVGEETFSPTDSNKNIEVIQNLVGISFLATSDQFMTMAFGQVTQIPTYYPVF